MTEQFSISRPEMEAALSLKDQDLFLELGRSGAGPSALPSDPRDLIDLGKRTFAAQCTRLRGALCSNSQVKHLATETPDDWVAIALEVVKILVALSTHIAPIPLAVLLVRKGLRNLCEVEWRNEDARS